MKTTHILDFGIRQPRRNLPAKIARKRGESNFVSAFTKAYIASEIYGFGGKEFALSGYGIADFVWLAWDNNTTNEDGTAISIEKINFEISKQRLTAFEMKLTDWRKGLAQTYRYSYFADLSILVLPPNAAKLAAIELHIFKKFGVALWSFERSSGKIRKLYTPRNSKPRNAKAREKAFELLGRSFKFGQIRKQPDSL